MKTNIKIIVICILIFIAVFFSVRTGLGNMADSVGSFFAGKMAEQNEPADAIKAAHQESLAKQRILIDKIDELQKKNIDLEKDKEDVEMFEERIKELQQSLTLKEKEVLAQAKELEKAKRAESKEVVKGDDSEISGGEILGFVVFLALSCWVSYKVGECA